jgi:hypothetical protein
MPRRRIGQETFGFERRETANELDTRKNPMN